MCVTSTRHRRRPAPLARVARLAPRLAAPAPGRSVWILSQVITAAPSSKESVGRMLPSLVHLKETHTACGLSATREFKWPCGILIYKDTTSLIVSTASLRANGALQTTIPHQLQNISEKLRDDFMAVQDGDGRYKPFTQYIFAPFIDAKTTLTELGKKECVPNSHLEKKLSSIEVGAGWTLVAFES